MWTERWDLEISGCEALGMEEWIEEFMFVNQLLWKDSSTGMRTINDLFIYLGEMWEPEERRWLEECGAVWSGLLLGFVKKEWVISQTVKKKLSCYTERRERLWGRIMLRRIFSSLCRISWRRQKTSNSDLQLNDWLVCRPLRWFQQEKHHAWIKLHIETSWEKKTWFFLYILYIVTVM